MILSSFNLNITSQGYPLGDIPEIARHGNIIAQLLFPRRKRWTR
jgi:hypothetical protein